MLYKTFGLFTLLSAICYTAEVTAIPRIESQEEDGVEADKIVLALSSDQSTGTVFVEGCRLCPLKLDVDKNTRFFVNHKLIDRVKAKSHSGNTGAVFFRKNQVTKVHW